MAEEPKDEGLTVEVATDDEKPGKPELTDEEVEKLDELPADDEIGNYAKSAQRRIKSLHIANQEWRRRVAQSTKDVATATTLAQQLYNENQQLKASTQRSEQALIDQALQRADAQLAQAKSHFLQARAASDAAQELTAQEEIARAVAEIDRLKLLRPAQPVKDSEPGAAPPAAAQPQAAAPPASAPAQVSDATQRWMGRNSWFNKPGEEEMTGFAMGVHQSLEKQGITENSNPKEYWGTIDKRLRETFPQRFEPKTEGGGRPVAVAAGTRTNGTAEASKRGPRHVVLTESQVRIAKSLGITNEQYAAQLVKEEAAAASRSVS